jgi:hypothetical protein
MRPQNARANDRCVPLPLHSGRESSIVDPMRLADWPMAYIGDMVPLAL